jgi:hypothetical protein
MQRKVNMLGIKLPDSVVAHIYSYDPTYHRDQHEQVMKEVVWVASVWNMIIEQKIWHETPTDGAEFKETAH